MKKAFIYILGSLLLFGLGAVLGMQISNSNSDVVRSEVSTKKTISYEPGDDFITNLSNSKKLLKTSIVIEVNNKKEIAYMTKNNYKVRDIIVDVLSQVTEEEVLKADIRNELKKEIHEELKTRLGLNGIVDVYFNDFVTQ